MVADVNDVSRLPGDDLLDGPSLLSVEAIVHSSPEERRWRRCCLAGGMAVEMGQPPEGEGDALVRPAREAGTVDAVAPELVGVPEPLLGVAAAEMGPLAAGLGFAGQCGGDRAEFPVGAASDEECIELVPRDGMMVEAVLGDQGHREAQGTDCRRPGAEKL